MRTLFLIVLVLAVPCRAFAHEPGTDPEPAAIDITDANLTSRSANCAEYAARYTASVTDVQRGVDFHSHIEVSPDGSSCVFTSNAIPNHDFDATGRFATPVREQRQTYSVPARPVAATSPTPLSLRDDDAVFLNGVKLDLLAAGCYGVGNGNIGCHDMRTPFRYDPLGPGQRFGADEHNAHTQPDGTYHYQGDPNALFEHENPAGPSPVIGFAADGFPIFGSWFVDGSGTLRKAKSSYRLESGTRPAGPGKPGGTYDGTFIDDWEYVEGSGDLDACNGMTVDGVYGYYVTDAYPHVLACFTGTPDRSFRKQR